MGPLRAPVFVFTVVLCLKTSVAYVEALAASTGGIQPAVAFKCGKPAMHKVVNGWEADFTKDCVQNSTKVLEYCKSLYPDHGIINVVEETTKPEIEDWPKFDGPDTDTSDDDVTVYKCLFREFESMALLVPQGCVFDHQHDSSRCESPSEWKKTASAECTSRHPQMFLKSYGMLVVCGTDVFRGVEYVCCPKDTPKEDSSSVDSSEEVLDNYRKYLRGDDMPVFENEHQKFKAAEKDMLKRQKEKVTGMMKEWQEAREHVSEMRKTNKQEAEDLNSQITKVFQMKYQAYEKEGASEKKQLVSLHQQRVQAVFNKKKRVLMTQYKDELESDKPRASKILSYLQQYIRVEEKDRLHTVNHWEHEHDTDVMEAAKIHDTLVNHIALITQRIEDAINMLNRVPELEKKLKAEIKEFRHKKFREITIGPMEETLLLKPQDTLPVVQVETHVESLPLDTVLDSVPVIPIHSEDEDSRDYTNIQIDSEENKPMHANAMNDGASLEQKSFNTPSVAAESSASTVGIAIGSVAVFIIIVVAIVMLRKRNRRQPITHGFVEVDPAASPEERHVANMQMNGYENPTYRYFEVSQ